MSEPDRKQLNTYVVCWYKDNRATKKAERHEVKEKKLILYVGKEVVGEFMSVEAWWIDDEGDN